MSLILCKLRHVTIRINPTFIPFPAPRESSVWIIQTHALRLIEFSPSYVTPEDEEKESWWPGGRVHASSSSSPVFVNKILVAGNHSLEETKLWPLVACQQVVKPVAGQTRYEELSN